MSTRTAMALALVWLAARSGGATTHHVEVGGSHGFAFSPMTVTIQPGDTVTWTNEGGNHSVTADNGSFDSGVSSNAWTFSHTYPSAGSFGYHCDEHGGPGSGMFGTVVVQAAGGPPAAPNGLTAVAASTSEVDLDWSDNSSNEAGFRVERRTVGEAFHEIATTGPNATSYHDGALDPSTFYLYRVRASGGTANSAYSNEASAATLGNVAPCVAGPETLCVNGGRFQAELEWRISDGTAGQGHAVPVASAPDSGLFYFFSPSNLEMLIKVLNACVAPYNRYWVFFAATTNVEFVVVVTDTQTGKTKPYFNPLNRAAPSVQDSDAFATCP